MEYNIFAELLLFIDLIFTSILPVKNDENIYVWVETSTEDSLDWKSDNCHLEENGIAGPLCFLLHIWAQHIIVPPKQPPLPVLNKLNNFSVSYYVFWRLILPDFMKKAKEKKE